MSRFATPADRHWRGHACGGDLPAIAVITLCGPILITVFLLNIAIAIDTWRPVPK